MQRASEWHCNLLDLAYLCAERGFGYGIRDCILDHAQLRYQL
jgi:hypothetical protein